MNIVAYLLKLRIMEPEKQSFLSNGCVLRNNGVIVRSPVSCTVSADAIQRDEMALMTSQTNASGTSQNDLLCI
jgi:hypothetical protein